MLDTKRHWFKWLEKIITKTFGVLPLTPNQYTYLSGVAAVMVFWFIVNNNLILGAIFFLIAAGMDLVDGAVARAKNMVTEKGAFLDTVFDRYIEVSILMGFFFLDLPEIILPAYVWIGLAIFGSIVTTYIPAAAQQKKYMNEQLKGGIMSRAERVIFMFLALVLATIYPDYIYATYVIIALAIISNLSAIQRFVMIILIKNQNCK